MDIGTDKPSVSVRSQLRHHLVDILDPSHHFDAGKFVTSADRLVGEIGDRDNMPIIAGGTAFYLRNFLYGLPESPPGCPRERMKLQRAAERHGTAALFEELKRVDRIAAAKIHENDRYRILRALEIQATSGRPASSYRVPSEMRDCFNVLLIGLTRERACLYARIDRRVEAMFARGLLNEVKGLLEMGYGRDDPGMKGIGYREFFDTQRGCLSLEGVRELIKRNSRRYAKRQMTAFRSLRGVCWFHPDDAVRIRRCMDDFVAASQT